jgi:RNA polymerase sigma-70 factor (ECF subfamily)
MEKEADLRRLEVCVEALEGDQQRVIRLFYLEEKSYNEITELTGLDWNQVRSYIQNGRRNLKNCMEKQKEKAYEPRK